MTASAPVSVFDAVRSRGRIGRGPVFNDADVVVSSDFVAELLPPLHRLDLGGGLFRNGTGAADSAVASGNGRRNRISLPRQGLRMSYGRAMLEDLLLPYGRRASRLGSRARLTRAARTRRLGRTRNGRRAGSRLLRRQAILLRKSFAGRRPFGFDLRRQGRDASCQSKTSVGHCVGLAARGQRLSRLGCGMDQRPDQSARGFAEAARSVRSVRATALGCRRLRTVLSEFLSCRASSSERLGNVAAPLRNERFRHLVVPGTLPALRFSRNRRRLLASACAALFRAHRETADLRNCFDLTTSESDLLNRGV